MIIKEIIDILLIIGFGIVCFSFGTLFETFKRDVLKNQQEAQDE